MRATVSARHSSDDGYWRCKLQPFSTEHVEILAGQPFKKAEVRKGRRLAGQSAAAVGNNPMPPRIGMVKLREKAKFIRPF